MSYPNRSDVSFPESSGIVSLIEVKNHLSLFSDDTFDAYLAEIIIAATTHAGTFIGQALEVMGVIDYYGSWDNRLTLSQEYIDTIESVSFYGSENEIVAVSPSEYMTDTSSELAAVVFTTPQSSALSGDIANPVQVAYNSLYVNATENRAIKQAVLIIVADLFKDRETDTEGGSTRSHLTAERLLAPYRRMRI